MTGGGSTSSRRACARRIVSIVGTRPEAIKMAPVVSALASRRAIDQQLILTGQHEGLRRHFDVPGLCMHELPLDPRGHSVARLREKLHALLCGTLERQAPDLVLVQGDTASAMAGAMAARVCGLAIGHVEAGLRSHDLRQPHPEEGYRTAIDAMSELLFAPTEAAAGNLRGEWRVSGQIAVTGNTGIDALLRARRRARSVPHFPRLILASCHRKENQGAPLLSVCAALKRIARELPVKLCVLLHPNRHARQALLEALGDAPEIVLVEPLEHEEMVGLMERSWLILSDSGGFQEEGPALGKPVLVLRNVTERPEALVSDNIELVGTDAQTVFEGVARLVRDDVRYAGMSRPSFPFGDGHAAERIAEIIEGWLTSRPRASAGRAAARAPRALLPAAR